MYPQGLGKGKIPIMMTTVPLALYLIIIVTPQYSSRVASLEWLEEERKYPHDPFSSLLGAPGMEQHLVVRKDALRCVLV